jgi:hypothetical protein
LFFPRIGHEELSARNVLQKVAGGLLIMAGVALIELQSGATH